MLYGNEMGNQIVQCGPLPLRIVSALLMPDTIPLSLQGPAIDKPPGASAANPLLISPKIGVLSTFPRNPMSSQSQLRDYLPISDWLLPTRETTLAFERSSP